METEDFFQERRRLTREHAPRQEHDDLTRAYKRYRTIAGLISIEGTDLALVFEATLSEIDNYRHDYPSLMSAGAFNKQIEIMSGDEEWGLEFQEWYEQWCEDQTRRGLTKDPAINAF